ncbi:MAG: DegT/DnrJ/EryC1/StrS family aminotransferase [Alphaproteobacteria bacterium]|nr:DegT/DnrJ/EryC1/StrS family aminotransferase [Alphaproteobacteria bacterium]
MIPRLSAPFDVTDAGALVSGWVRPGGEVAFEAAVAEMTGKRFVLAFPSGRSGFHALIKAMGWQDREIVLPAYTCAVMGNTVLASGNRPRLVDIEDSDFNMGFRALASAVGRDTAAVVATHMYGFPMDLEGLGKVLEGRPEVVVIQDCALALGARYQGRPVWRDGLAVMFSFSLGKHLSTVEGGVMATDDEGLYAAMKDYRDGTHHPAGIVRAARQSAFFMAGWLGLRPWLYSLVHGLTTRTGALGFLSKHYEPNRVYLPPNFRERLPNCLGHLGANQVGKASGLVSRRIEISEAYRRELAGVPGLSWPSPRDGASFSHCPCLIEDRDGFIAFMTGQGIHVGKEVFDYALPDIPLFAPFADGDCLEAKKVARWVALLPNHPGLSDNDVEQVIAATKRWGVL